MYKSTIVIAMALLRLNCGLAQVPMDTPKPLQIGDQLPALFWEGKYQLMAQGKTFTSNLSAYKGKPLLIDFWASWCSSCLKKMPVLDSLAKTGNINVLLVNCVSSTDDLGRVGKRLATFGSGFRLQTVYQDTYIGQLFPHRLLPHYVWVDRGGRVLAMTSSAMVTPASIANFMKDH